MGTNSSRASLERLKFCNFKLDSLLDITLAINNNLSTEKLLETYQVLLCTQLNIGKVLVYAYNSKSWEIILQAGSQLSDFKNIDIIKDLLPYTEITTTFSINNDHLKSFDVIIPIFNNENALAYVLIGDFEEEKAGISPTIKHLHFIQTLTNIIIVAIENKRLMKENVQQERMKKELEMASKMQEMLIPDTYSLPKSTLFKIDSFYLPHFEVGGDYFDCDRLTEDEIFFCIADVSGKGMSAALLMSNFQANLRALFTSDIVLPELIQKLNDSVNHSAKGERFLTFFVAKFNTISKQLRYINAGHLPPILYDKNLKTFKYLDLGCIGMGMFEEIPIIREGVVTVAENSKLLCFTDGLIELECDNQIQSAQKAVELCMATDYSISQTIINIIKELDINKSNPVLFDDITILGIEFY